MAESFAPNEIRGGLSLWLWRASIAHSISIRDFAATIRTIKIMLIQGFSYRFNGSAEGRGFRDPLESNG
jgi:hypothetical protein